MGDWQDELDDVYAERFWAKVRVEPGTDCYIWTGALDKYGYGAFKVADGARKAHRVAWALVHGRVPDHLTLDHVCRDHACVNPAHMELVTLEENGLRGRIDQHFDGLEAKARRKKKG